MLTLAVLLCTLVLHPAADISRKRAHFSVMETTGMCGNLLLRACTNLADPTSAQAAAAPEPAEMREIKEIPQTARAPPR